MRSNNNDTRIAELRLDKELRQKDISKKLKVLESTYSKWERGINDIPLTKANDLANLYEASFDYMLGISDVNTETERKTINLKLLCQRLLELRKERKLTQDKVSADVGYPQRTYANYENGDRVPTTFKVMYLAIYYNVSFDYLVGRTDNKKIK